MPENHDLVRQRDLDLILWSNAGRRQHEAWRRRFRVPDIGREIVEPQATVRTLWVHVVELVHVQLLL